ncbi:hypothetical protein B0H11DRAFT_2077966 [Mycena galericulata]|nr:hypothetical protein B0H11DRAFT_2077966 [Mycena galericulata]
MFEEELEARLEKISADIERQKEALERLEISRILVQRQLNAIRDPVARLPLEISSEIFIHCLPPHPEPGAHNIPMLLLNICKAWSDIALSTPVLWAAIRVVFPRAQGFKEVFGVWLQRARNRPLSISLHKTFEEDVAAIVLRHSHQLKNLEIYHEEHDEPDDAVEGSDEVRLLGGISVGPFPLLQTLAIRGNSGYRQGYWCYQILDLLRLAPNLVHCAFDQMYPVYNVSTTTEKLVLPALRHLAFGRQTDVDTDDEILTCLSLPNLQTLSLPLAEIKADELVSFLKRSSPRLHTLAIGSMGFVHFPRLEECLHLVPTLIRLELWGGHLLVGNLVAALAESPSHMLPNLRSLTIHLYSEIDSAAVFWMTLLGALSARRTQITNVEIVRISEGIPPPDDELCAAFGRLGANGMDIYIGTEERNDLSF